MNSKTRILLTTNNTAVLRQNYLSIRRNIANSRFWNNNTLSSSSFSSIFNNKSQSNNDNTKFNKVDLNILNQSNVNSQCDMIHVAHFSILHSKVLLKPKQKIFSTLQLNKKLSTKMENKPTVQIDNMNQNFIKMEYAVRGPLVIRAGEIEKELQNGIQKPFDQVIRANIGDCHAMGQKPITYLRQVLALMARPELLDSNDFPADTKERCKLLLSGCQGQSMGSYTDSAGIELIRRQVADFITARDGCPADYLNIILTAGATAGIKSLLCMLNAPVDGKPPGIMIPIPQYPLYSATLAEYGLNQIDYYLDESTNWGLNISELKRSITEARKKFAPRALCIINPGNPTGQVLTRKNIEEIIKFAYDEKLFLFADEVYQDNIHDPKSKFHSFKKVMMEMGEPYCHIELASFMSTSKGYLGECGIRGGYTEVINLCPKVKAMLLKSISASLCPTTAGQIAVSCLVAPPCSGDPSYDLYIQEKNCVLESLKERAELVYKTFNSFEGFSCNVVQGAMYAFPQIKIPQKAIDAAKKAGKAPDVFYASELLESTGICIVPGTGFGQQPGTHHFRTTILPQTDKLKIMLSKFQEFHAAFMQKYK